MSLQEKIAEQFIHQAIDKLDPKDIIEKLTKAAEAKLAQLKADKNHNGIVDGVEIAQKIAVGAQAFKEAFELLAAE